MQEPSVFLEWLSDRLVLLGLASLISDHRSRCYDQMVDYHWYELDHFEIGRDLILDLWLVLLQFILGILLVFTR